MGSRTKDVRLVASERMLDESSKENDYIRVPRRARLYFDSKGDRIVISVGDRKKVLHIRPAYESDVQKLIKEVKKGTVSEQSARATGFVTPGTLSYLTSYSQEKERHCFLTDGVEDIMIGADPEFALVNPNTGIFQYAQHVSGLSLQDQLGHDGPLAERRPPPATEVGKFVDNISEILRRDGHKVRGYQWRGGAAYKRVGAPSDERTVHIGGHIQFGNPVLLPTTQINAIYRQTVRILDELVALPLVKIDTPLPHLRRNTKWGNYGRYGRWADHKAKENRFEWRVPSGLWLVHPDLARAVLGASKAVVEHGYQLMADNKFDASWICAQANHKGFLKTMGAMSGSKVESLINNADPKAVTIELINRAAKRLRGLENYDKYKAEIDEFVRLVKMKQADRDRLNLDLKKSWLDKGNLITGG